MPARKSRLSWVKASTEGRMMQLEVLK